MYNSINEGNNVPLLEMREITKSYSGITVLKNVNLKINPGEVLALVGENGAGKSTLIKTISGAIQKNSGEMFIKGEKVEFSTPKDAEDHRVVTVYQELNLFPYLSVAENLFLNKYLKSNGLIDWKALNKKADNILQEFGLHLPVNKKVADLSIAEKQMLEIAKALFKDAKILILDEPTAVLGGEDVDRLLTIVQLLKKRRIGILFISHRLNEIFEIADNYLVLKDGMQVGAGSIKETNETDLISMMVGRSLKKKKTVDYRTAEELLRVSGLSRKGILYDIDLTLKKGEILGIAGLRGAGRTELARAIFGADPINSGHIYMCGQEVKIDSPKTAVNKGIGLVPEDRRGQGLFQNLSTIENIFMSSLTKVNQKKKKEKEIAENYVKSLAIKVPNFNLLVGGLSGGNQQKIVLAKWLQAGIKVLILDEPTRGIDVGSKEKIFNVVEELCKSGIGVILISSELPEILEMSNRILVMQKGRIAGELDGESATEESVMRLAVGGGN